MELAKYIRETPQGVTLAIRVQPRSSRDEFITAPNAEHLKVRITAPPVDSAANNALPKFISKTLGVSPSAVSLIGGKKSRNKTLLITGTDAQAVAEKLRAQK
ncbi:MAG: YggU family protein [Verrucomicrobia bacterium]|nr:YggU family protein [Verrucomicrobiota bacterium]MBT6658995.1 YggU family protein [Verrucomicrobiota bacterium]